jgi:hypothetical protein
MSLTSFPGLTSPVSGSTSPHWMFSSSRRASCVLDGDGTFGTSGSLSMMLIDNLPKRTALQSLSTLLGRAGSAAANRTQLRPVPTRGAGGMASFGWRGGSSETPHVFGPPAFCHRVVFGGEGGSRGGRAPTAGTCFKIQSRNSCTRPKANGKKKHQVIIITQEEMPRKPITLPHTMLHVYRERM